MRPDITRMKGPININTINSLPIKIPELGSYLRSNCSIKDYWEEECKEHPSKRGCIFYCD